MRPAKALVLLLLFAVITAQRSVVHPCPFHGDPAGTTSAHAGHGQPQAPAHQHGAHNAATEQPAQSATEPHSCNCLGDCSAGNVVRIPSAPAQLVALVEAAAQVVPIPDASRVAIQSPPFVLPFANGPPSHEAARIA